ncbi:MAG: hypothetical protein ACRDRY_20120 [Pseudonocardiaceae bacterium]
MVGVPGAPNLQLLLRAGSGLDNVDVAAATRRSGEVVRVPSSARQRSRRTKSR